MNNDNNEKILLPVKPIEQKYTYNCGPTALLIVIRYQFNLNLTQEDINFLTGVTPDGCSEYHFFKALKSLGFKYEEGKGNLSKLKNYLRNNLPVIVHVVLEDGEGHFAVVIGIDNDFVYLADPRNGSIVKWGIPFFLGVWKEEDFSNSVPWYLVIIGQTSNHKIDSMIKRLNRIRKKLS